LVSNNHNQLFEPDPYAAKRFLARNYFGVGKAGAAAMNISDTRAIADSLRILYSYITIGCVLYSANDVSQHAAAGVNYTSFRLGDLRCPSNEIEGNLWGEALSIPSAYVRCDGCSPAAAPTLDMASNGRSCTSFAPIRLQTSFYECCRPMPIIDRIAQTSAFSIFCGMISVIVTTVALFPYTMAPTAPPDPATAPC
jgi:hypothetical protein